MMANRAFTHALVRMPGQNMADGLTTQELGSPIYDLAMEQYGQYLQALTDCGLSVVHIHDDAPYPDGHFIEDTVILYRDLAVITQPGAESRRDETLAVAPHLPQKTEVYMGGEAYLDGGDVLFCADRVLIGVSERTNRAGAEQLRAALQNYDARLRIDLVPFAGVLHLKTGLTELAPGVFIRSPQLDTDFSFNFAQTLMLPAGEGYAANVLPINGALMILAGFPSARRFAAQHYTRILEIPMTEFQKMDGSLTCLSLLYAQ